MKINVLFTFFLVIQALVFCEMEARTDFSKKAKKQMTEYFYISVDFYSQGQGVDQQSQQNLFDGINKIQKEFIVVIFYERIRWGKEGEFTIYIDIRKLAPEERVKFLQKLQEMFRDRNRMAIVHSNLYFDPVRNNLALGVSQLGQLENREKILLDYIARWEKRSRFKINTGDMINETAIPEDQDRRIELNLAGLEKTQILEIVNKAQEIMQVKLPDIFEVDFKGIGGANDRAYKGYLVAFINKFEKENKHKVEYQSNIYEMDNGGEIFNIRIHNLTDELKIKFVETINKMYANVSNIQYRYF